MLAGASGLLLVTTVLVTTWQVGLAVADRDAGETITAIAFGGMQALFWKWIGLGAWERARPAIDPETGEPLPPSEPIGPWGWVGRGLLAVLVIGFVGIGAWATLDAREQDVAVDRVRDDADRAARRADLTVADVVAVVGPDVDSATGLDRLERLERLERLDQLLGVEGAAVIDASAGDGRAAVLLEPTRGAPCVVLEIDRNDLASTRLVSSC